MLLSPKKDEVNQALGMCLIVSNSVGSSCLDQTNSFRGLTVALSPGHILTRVVSKGSTALGILHEYDQECETLRALLAQRVWRRGKRGAWYDRLALVLMNHYGGDEEKKREAVEVCLDGLEDADTHLSESCCGDQVGLR